MQGLWLSTVAATDDHRAHPGQPHYGRTAVRATGLTREEIFDGLYHRRSYGTTGAKILLDFAINDEPMGARVTLTEAPRLKIEAHGTAPIDVVEVLRYSKSEPGFHVLFKFHPGDTEFEWAGIDTTFREDSIYYVRLREAELVRNRVVMAWSSPIWVKQS